MPRYVVFCHGGRKTKKPKPKSRPRDDSLLSLNSEFHSSSFFSSFHSRGAPRVMASTAATFSSSSRAMLAVLVACLALASSASAAGAAPTTNDGGAGGGGAGASRFLFQAATISDAVVPAGGALATCEVGVHECNADKYLKKVGVRGVTCERGGEEGRITGGLGLLGGLCRERETDSEREKE
jgi:hypothetical protein